jgi:hypothetical protein
VVCLWFITVYGLVLSVALTYQVVRFDFVRKYLHEMQTETSGELYSIDDRIIERPKEDYLALAEHWLDRPQGQRVFVSGNLLFASLSIGVWMASVFAVVSLVIYKKLIPHLPAVASKGDGDEAT